MGDPCGVLLQDRRSNLHHVRIVDLYLSPPKAEVDAIPDRLDPDPAAWML